jgi:hypothetical protein
MCYNIFFIAIHSFIHSLPSVLRQVHIFFQSDFSRECDLILPRSSCSIFPFPWEHPVAAYIFFLVFSSVLAFLWWRVLEGTSKTWTIQVAFFHFIVRWIFVSSLSLCDISFCTRKAHLIFSILLQHNTSELSGFFWSVIRSVKIIIGTSL